MSTPERLALRACAGMAALLLLSPISGAAARDGRADPLAQYRSNEQVHGLYEVREAARKFLVLEGVRKNGTYSAMDPDLRIVVPRCVVPLTARWARKTMYHEGPGVDVLCKKSVDRRYARSWDVFVPLFEPAVAEKWRALEDEKHRNAAKVK
jgi:hypothetical protein